MSLGTLKTLASKPLWQSGRRQIQDSPELWPELMGIATCDQTSLRDAVLSKVQELFDNSPRYVHWATVTGIVEQEIFESIRRLPVRRGLPQQYMSVAVPTAFVNRVACDVKREYECLHPSDANSAKFQKEREYIAPIEFFEIPDDVYQDKIFAADCVRASHSCPPRPSCFIAVLNREVVGSDDDPVTLLKRVSKEHPSVDPRRFVIEFTGIQEE